MVLSWDVVVGNSSVVLSNLDLWISNRDSGARVSLKSSPFIDVVSYNIYLGTSPRLFKLCFDNELKYLLRRQTISKHYILLANRSSRCSWQQISWSDMVLLDQVIKPQG